MQFSVVWAVTETENWMSEEHNKHPVTETDEWITKTEAENWISEEYNKCQETETDEWLKMP